MRRALLLVACALGLLFLIDRLLAAAVDPLVSRDTLPLSLPDYREYAGPPTATIDNCRYWNGQPHTGQPPVIICSEE